MTEPSAPSSGLDPAPIAGQRRIKDILKSTLFVGGGSIVTVATGVVRGKVISMLLGPAGMGLQGLLQSTLRTGTAIAGMGLSTSGVREVARLRGENDPEELSHTLRGLRSATAVLGLVAALILIVFHRPLGAAILDDADLGWTLAVIGIGVFAQVFDDYYDAYLRGFRRVALVTKAGVLANILSTAVAVGLVYLLRDNGIAWALVSQPVLIVVFAGIASRDVSQHLRAPDRARIQLAFKRVIRMGVVLASTGFVGTGAQLGARVLIARFTTLDDVGYFQAAWAVSVLYLGFVLGAMSLDYYPRLAEAGNDRAALTGMVNEQARVSFLLAGPAILGVLAFSSQVIAILYTSKFTPSVEILRWQLLGDVLKIGSWTLSYLVLAQGRPRVYFFTELTWNVAYLVALLVFLPALGVVAAGIAYVVASGAYFAILCFVASRLAGFSWNRSNIGMMVVIALLSGVSFAAQLLLSRWPALAIGGALTLGFGGYCLWKLVHEAGLSRLLGRGRKPR